MSVMAMNKEYNIISMIYCDAFYVDNCIRFIDKQCTWSYILAKKWWTVMTILMLFNTFIIAQYASLL